MYSNLKKKIITSHKNRINLINRWDIFNQLKKKKHFFLSMNSVKNFSFWKSKSYIYSDPHFLLIPDAQLPAIEFSTSSGIPGYWIHKQIVFNIIMTRIKVPKISVLTKLWITFSKIKHIKKIKLPLTSQCFSFCYHKIRSYEKKNGKSFYKFGKIIP